MWAHPAEAGRAIMTEIFRLVAQAALAPGGAVGAWVWGVEALR
jgi:hypothetical protein